MKSFLRKHLPTIDTQIWILAIGRLLSEVGTGFTLFYAPIFFVNQIGLSATTVGIALASHSISGVFGRILGGSLTDSLWGRRRTLLLSAAISAVGSLVLAATHDFVTLVIGNLINGLGVGLYWPATEAVVADLTNNENRREAFAITRFADNIGLGLGIVLAGVLVTNTANYRLLFILDGLSFIIFFAVIYVAIKQNRNHTNVIKNSILQQLASWIAALKDSRLLIFVVVNIIFTTYISQLHSTLPLYFKNFIQVDEVQKGFVETTISALFTWHLIVAIITQLPIARLMKRLSHSVALSISACLWAIGFICIWVTSFSLSHSIVWVALALCFFALAIVSYTPSAAALVSEIAPIDKRGIYFSINSLCWAAGYLIGPPLGGWVLDQSQFAINNFWLSLSVSVVFTMIILRYLHRLLSHL
ncbi:Major Facilitator Superfamily transporter [Rivularia sp. PCC 7116]|uniref:MDR family MFS transporter n=1 Tax=Rivularia sp. PCC 7116 TaxID=373994 RepID=UPI00029EC46A|nr:MFS transporter [Rivularia sp. PCC 7116]AFY57687.1 Major Facilitator Superfamily transporter [Rivularia sp. PCC 7116]